MFVFASQQITTKYIIDTESLPNLTEVYVGNFDFGWVRNTTMCKGN